MASDRIYTAWFPKMAYAVEFADRIRGDGWWATDVVQKGRTVTWRRDGKDYTDDGTYFADMLATVGFYGSTQNRKAKLDGVPAPMSY